jgi:hypothetical protein
MSAAAMLSVDDAIVRVRARVAGKVDIIPADWPATTYNAPEGKADYLVFCVIWPGDQRRVGASQYVAVHQATGDVLDLGEHGE